MRTHTHQSAAMEKKTAATENVVICQHLPHQHSYNRCDFAIIQGNHRVQALTILQAQAMELNLPMPHLGEAQFIQDTLDDMPNVTTIIEFIHTSNFHGHRHTSLD